MYYSLANQLHSALNFGYGYVCIETGDITKIGNCLDPDPTNVKGNDVNSFIGPIDDVLGLVSFLAGVLAVAAIVLIGIRIIAARAGNNPDASAKALGGLPWIAVGLVLILAATQIVDLVYFS